MNDTKEKDQDDEDCDHDYDAGVCMKCGEFFEKDDIRDEEDDSDTN